MILALTLALMVTAQPATPVCDLVSNEEVASLIGTVKSKQPLIDANTCTWSGDRVTFSIMRTPEMEPEAANAVMGSIKTRARAGDVVADEAGIGTRAVSEVSARGSSISMFALGGATTMWTVRLDHVYSGLKPEDVLPKLRAIAKKVVR